MNIQKRRGLSAFAIAALFTILSFQNCSKVAFQEEELPIVAESITQASEIPVSCVDGQLNDAIRWDLLANQNIEEQGQCQYGGNLTKLYEKYQKSVCTDGKYVGTSDVQKGNLLGQRGACNCAGGVNHGMTTWQVVPGTIPEPGTCPESGMVSLNYEKEQQYTCANGTLTADNVFRKGKFLNQSGACKCASGAAEGSATYKLVPNANIPEAGKCLYGGNLQYFYEKLQKYTCTNSQSMAQNEFMKGKLLNTTGACNCEGGILNGGFKYADLPGQTIPEDVSCKYGGDLKNLYAKQEKLICSNANFTNSGQYQRGAFIKQTGACNPPPVLSEEIPISVAKAEKPLDMIWIVDNSGSMGDEAANVRKNLGSFLSALDTGADMKFLLISDKGNSGTSVSIPAGLDPARFVQANVSVSSTGGSKMLLDQLEKYQNKGTPFFRSFSRKIIVFVSDASSAIPPRELLSELSTYGASTPDLSIFGFIGIGEITRECKFGDGSDYRKMATDTKGKVFNICETDWTQHFANLKTDILTNVSRVFNPKQLPATAKITKIEVDGVVISPNTYTFAGGLLTLKPEVKVTETTVVKIYFTPE